ncbi:MAG: energy transducer TonB [Crocinitomix sp.]|nr:energy transducer TonB [Crocinitomix sp.]
MEAKKTKKANLENKRLGFFFVGLVMTGSIVGMAINYTEASADPYLEKIVHQTLPDEVIFEIVEEEEVPEKLDTQTPAPPMPEIIEIVPDDKKIPPIDFTIIDEDPVIITKEPEFEIIDEIIYESVAIEPSFPGGDAEFANFIKSNIVYPELASEMGEQGIVYVKFVVNRDGSIEQVSIRQSVTESLDKEAMRVVKKMPNWIPGEQGGKKVRVSYTLPISFRLG